MSAFSSFLSTASSYINTSQIQSNYTINSNSPSIFIGIWKVDKATHNSNGKVISIWSTEKSSLVRGKTGGSAGNPGRLDIAVDILKKEISSLSRLRHPCILEVAEPMEETRSTITYATEPITASLRIALNSDTRSSSSSSRNGNSNRSSGNREEEEDLELDEVEIQKGLSQVAKGLIFLHDSAKLAHNNLTLDSIIINAKGDWKLSGFGLSIYFLNSEGIPAKWEFPSYDTSLSKHCQRDYDYIAPEDILDESPPAPARDLYSLGIIIHAIHTKTGPPFANHNSLQKARTNIEDGLTNNSLIKSSWRKLPEEAQSVLEQLITRYPSSRLSATKFLAHTYFSNLLVSTLRFLEKDSFTACSSEQQANFLKGLLPILDRFSTKVNRRKILPSLLEETRKQNLIPFLLPNILHIASKLDPESFRSEVLPSLKSLFIIKEPPQAVIALLDSLPIFAEKCTAIVFRDEVMPLVYNALESENPTVLEKALRVVPGLSETLDYTTVKSILFPKITSVFSKTTMLAVKVNTLICFHSMIKTLDKTTLTEKLVPLLAKIKTKEPSVSIATLAVMEEIGKKCEIEAIATLILPQLWALSVGPLLNADQFAKFMIVIKKLSQRVESEHSKALAELKRLEQSGNNANNSNSSTGGSNSNSSGNSSGGGGMDFESLVRSGVGATKKEVAQDMWADDSPSGSGSITPISFASNTPTLSPSFSSNPTLSPRQPPLNPSKSNSALGARSIPTNSFNSTAFISPPLPQPPTFSPPPTYNKLPPLSSMNSSSNQIPIVASSSGLNSFVALQPSSRSGTPNSSSSNKLQSNYSNNSNSASSSTYNTGQSNYNLSLSPQIPSPSIYTSQLPSISTNSSPSNYGMQPLQPTSSSSSSTPSSSTSSAAKPTWNIVPPPPGFNSNSNNVLVPKVIERNKINGSSGNGVGGKSFGDWADLDPLN